MLPVEAAASRYRWVILAALIAVVALRIPVGLSLGILLPDITSTLGLSPVEQGWLGSALNLGNVVLGLPAAWLLSRYNPRLLLLLSTAVATGLTFAQAAAGSFASLMALRVLTGIAFISMSPARTLLLQRWFPLREIVLVNGLQIAVVGIGEAATMSLTPLLLASVGSWRASLFAFGLMGLAATVLWLAVGRDRPRGLGMETGGTDSPILVLRQRPILWVIVAGQLTAPAFWWAYATFWPATMLDRFGMPLSTSGFLFGLTSLGMAPAGLLFGWLCSSRPALKPLVLAGCGVALVLSSLAMLLTDSVPLLVLVCLVGGFGWGFVPVMSSIPFELPGIQPREVAVVSSFFWTGGSLGGMIGPATAGWLIEATGEPLLALGSLAVLPLVLSLSGIAVRIAVRQEPRRSPAGAAEGGP